MQLKTITHQTIALAGMTQATTLVQQFAVHGTADKEALETSIGSVLKIDSANVLDVYGGLSGLKLGLEQLNEQLSNFSTSNRDQVRYVASLMLLGKLLCGQAKMLKIIEIGVSKAQAQAEHFGLLHENVLANLAEIYQNTLSQLEPRIMVNGEASYLTRSDISDKIRACLLAGIRSSILWKQCGGTRWSFLWSRKKIHAELQVLLRQV